MIDQTITWMHYLELVIGPPARQGKRKKSIPGTANRITAAVAGKPGIDEKSARGIVYTGRVSKLGLIASLLVILAMPATGAEAGHYVPGVVNIRDWSVPEKGWYFIQYNTGYRSSNLRDAEGAPAGDIVIAGKPYSVRPVNTGTFAPMFLWSTGKQVAGADFAMMISPTFGKTPLANRLYALNSRQVSGSEQWGVGDMFVQPIRLRWGAARNTLTAAYGFYAPVGSYTAHSPGNVGLGFWSQQFSASLYHYFDQDQTTALMFTTVYEVSKYRSGTTDTPGGHVGLEYGVSRYLGKRFEIGAAGFDYFQVSNDRGADAASYLVYERVHGLGPQVKVWIAPSRLSVAFRILREYGAKARFEGTTANLTLTYVFRSPN